MKKHQVTNIWRNNTLIQEPMASTCSICKQRVNTPSLPSVWCQTCDILLCEPCEGKHQLSNRTKNHNTIPFEEYQKLPPFILNTNFNCDYHDKKLTDLCRVHDQAICITCRSDSHKECKDVPKIDDVVANVKDSAVFEDIISEIGSICGTLRAIAKDRDENLKQLKRNQEETVNQFERKFDQMINHLITLKERTISKLNDTHTKLVNDLSNTLQIVQSKEKKLSDILNQKSDIKKFASNYQTFISIKKMENMAHETSVNIQELFENKKIDKCNIIFDVNKTIQELASGVQSLGDIQVTKSPSAVSTHVTRRGEAQIEVITPAPVQLKFQQRINLDKKSNYSSCCTLSNGLLVFADFGEDENSANCKLCIQKPDGSLRSTIKFKQSEGVGDVTSVDDHHVAVSHPHSGNVSIIDLDKGIFKKGKVIKTLNIGGVVVGLCCRDRDIVCCVAKKGLIKVNIDSGKVEYVHVVKEGDAYFIQVSSNLICYTCPHTNTVTVLDTQYNVIFTYKDEDVLDIPMGVTIDDHDNIYVTGCVSNNLVVISPDGKSCHQLLGEEDGLFGPTAVHYDSSTKNLVVVNKDGPAFVFSVE